MASCDFCVYLSRFIVPSNTDKGIDSIVVVPCMMGINKMSKKRWRNYGKWVGKKIAQYQKQYWA
jgi:hypothetical protein